MVKDYVRVEINNLLAENKDEDFPIYLFDLKQLEKNYKVFREYFKDYKIYFALKSNSNKEILKALKHQGCNFESASLGEVKALLDIGVKAENIVYSNPVVSLNEIKTIYEKGIRTFVFENIETLKNLAEHAPGSMYILRINIHEHNKEFMDFGATLDYIKNMAEKEPELSKQVHGLTFYGEHASALKICKQIIQQHLPNIKLINLGGRYHHYDGLLEDLKKGEKTGKFDYFIENINKLKSELDINFMLEPGESMLYNVGYAISKIKYVNNSNVKGPYYHIDTGPSLGVNIGEHDIMFITNYSAGEKVPIAYVTDPTCLKQVICTLNNMPLLKEGDTLIIPDFGRYSEQCLTDFHLLKPPKYVYIKNE